MACVFTKPNTPEFRALETGYSVPEVCKISGNSYRTIAHYAHVNEKRVFEKWKAFEYGSSAAQTLQNRTATVQREVAKAETKALRKAQAAPRRKCKTAPVRGEFFTLDGGELVAGWSSLVARRTKHNTLKNQCVWTFVQQLYSRINDFRGLRSEELGNYAILVLTVR